MDRELRYDTAEVRGRMVTLLVLAASLVLTWVLLESFRSTTGTRQAPGQAPAGQEPMQRGTPRHDQDLMS